MTTSLLQPQKLPPANDGHVRDNLTADERLLCKAVQRVLKAQVAEVHSKVEGGAKTNAVPERTTKWDQEVMREVRPIWFGLFKKGGDRALQNIRRFPKHARKMAVLSWAEMQASERVVVVCKGGEGSGNFGHSGRPGERGGSGPGGGSLEESGEGSILYRGEYRGLKEKLEKNGIKGIVRDGRPKSVYMTTSLEEAHQYGVYHSMGDAKHKFTDTYAIVAIRIPSGEKLIPDERDTIGYGMKGAVRLERNIPSDWIQSIEERTIPESLRGRTVDEVAIGMMSLQKSAADSVCYFVVLIQPEKEQTKSLKATPSIVIPEWIEDPDVLTALENEMFKFAHGINQTTADALRDELIAGMENGETISQLADRISGLSDEWVEGWRSEMIARTETARAFSTGHIEAWRSTGVVDRKVWVAAGDACPFCQQMDGTVVELDENFFDQGDEQTTDWRGQEVVMGHDYSDVNGPPLHPNCRCVLVAELEEEKAIQKGILKS